MLQHLQPDNCLELLYKVTQSMDPDLQRVCVDVAAQRAGPPLPCRRLQAHMHAHEFE